MLRFDSPELIAEGEHTTFREPPTPLAVPRFVGGCHYLGRLCPVCYNDEIERYHQRLMADDRYAGGSTATRTKIEEKAATTCKCEADLDKYSCYGHRYQFLRKIKAKCEANAAWLERITLLPGQNSAIYNPSDANFTLVQTHRINANLETLPCRCGRDIGAPLPGAQVRANGVPCPVAVCVACSGVEVDTAHWMVTTYVMPGPGNVNTILRPRSARNVAVPVHVLPPVPKELNLKLKRTMPQQ
ncbi:hypothetical protein LTR09_007650 [Extremus antarcticus]|uniref:Uncharacterized protein n=1 Tax=Extremus antarcticus TaxID=702011 RepID=A0AAJ0DJ08_9PEZI|nr:hypothetical protein LTR09_007650 [Extremus antarcticus]